MKPFSRLELSLLWAALAQPFASADNVTLYNIEYTSVTRTLFSPTGEIFTVKPISTLSDGRTAYEVQKIIEATVAIDASTTSTMASRDPPTTTTYTYLADATQHEVTQYLTRGSDVVIVNPKCTKRDVDGGYLSDRNGIRGAFLHPFRYNSITVKQSWIKFCTTRSEFALNLTEVLNTTASLSRVSAILSIYPSLLEILNTTEVTFFAPSNEALDTFVLSQGGPSNITMAMLVDLISYHTVPHKLSSPNLSIPGGMIVDTHLNSTTYANLEGQPNVVYASAFGRNGQENAQGSLMLYSGVGEVANVTSADVEFEGGVVHTIDHVLNFPRPCTETTQAASLNTLMDAFRKTNLWQTVDSTPKFTCFAPTDEAFQAAGVDVQSFSEERLGNLLKYHLIQGEVGYSTALEDGKQYQTMLGVPVTVHKQDGQLYVNNVTVRTSNVIMNNGVAHILDGVLDVLTGVLTPSSNATISNPGAPSTTQPTTQTLPGDISPSSGATGSNSASAERPSVAGLILSIVVSMAYFATS